MAYEKNAKGQEIYEWDGKKTIYKIDNETGKEILAKDDHGNYYYGYKYSDKNTRVEYLPMDMSTGEPIRIVDSLELDTFLYPCDLETGDPEYEKNKYWTSKVLGEYYGTNYYERNMQTYAKDSNAKDILAKNEDGEEYYAKNLNTNEEIYPIDYSTEREFYKTIDGVEYPISSEIYAKDIGSGEEIYPKRFI